MDKISDFAAGLFVWALIVSAPTFLPQEILIYIKNNFIQSSAFVVFVAVIFYKFIKNASPSISILFSKEIKKSGIYRSNELKSNNINIYKIYYNFLIQKWCIDGISYRNNNGVYIKAATWSSDSVSIEEFNIKYVYKKAAGYGFCHYKSDINNFNNGNGFFIDDLDNDKPEIKKTVFIKKGGFFKAQFWPLRCCAS